AEPPHIGGLDGRTRSTDSDHSFRDDRSRDSVRPDHSQVGEPARGDGTVEKARRGSGGVEQATGNDLGVGKPDFAPRGASELYRVPTDEWQPPGSGRPPGRSGLQNPRPASLTT